MGMEIVQVMMRAEEEFEIEIPDTDAQAIATVGALSDYVAVRVPLEAGVVWERVRAMVSDEEEIPIHLIERGSRWVEDLGMG